MRGRVDAASNGQKRLAGLIFVAILGVAASSPQVHGALQSASTSSTPSSSTKEPPIPVEAQSVDALIRLYGALPEHSAFTTRSATAYAATVTRGDDADRVVHGSRDAWYKNERMGALKPAVAVGSVLPLASTRAFLAEATRPGRSTSTRIWRSHGRGPRTRTATAISLAAMTTLGTRSAQAATYPTMPPTPTSISDCCQGYTGTIPTELGLYTDITRFMLYSNSFSGTLPTELARLTASTIIYADRMFEGTHSGRTLPSEFGMLASLTSYFSVTSNSLNGTIPTELANIGSSSFESRMYLDSNRLSGPVPSQFGKFTDLTAYITAESNQLTGSLPTQFGQMTRVTEYVEFMDNQISGAFPTELGQMTGMSSFFKWYSNKFCSDLPTEVQALSSSITSFQLSTGNSIGTTCDCYDFSETRFPEICSTTEVAGVDASSQYYTGTIPTQLGYVTEASYLWLEYNSFSGTLPTELGLLTSTTVVYGQYMFGATHAHAGRTIPSEFGMLSSATSYVDMRYNSLNGTIPTELANIGSSSLESGMYLDSNRLSGPVPSQIGKFTDLTEYITAGGNQLTGSLPTQFGQMTKVTSYVEFMDNQISGAFPTELGQMTGMSSFFKWYSNKFCSDLPTEVQALSSSVTSFQLSTGNSIGTTCDCYDVSDTRFPEICSTDEAAGIYAQYSAYTGTIPTQLGYVTEASYLWLDYNSFSGTLPTELGLLTSATSVTGDSMFGDTYTNSERTLPSEFGMLASVNSYFPMRYNSLNGTIPTELANIGSSSFESGMYLDSNRLSGPVPSQIGKFTDLTESITAGGNELTGSLPTQFGQMTKVTGYVEFMDNQISGAFPTELGQMTGMSYYFQWYSNKFCSDLPTEVQALSSSVSWFQLSTGNSFGTICGWQSYMADNRFPTLDGSTSTVSSQTDDSAITGTIPTEFGLMTEITEWTSNTASLTGTFPSELFNLYKLVSLASHDNALSGGIPSEVGKATGLWAFQLQNNNYISGTLPTEVGFTTATTNINVGGNMIGGEIPTQFGNWASFVVEFMFNQNSLSGQLPTQLGRMSVYESFNIEDNKLNSTIPTQFGQFVIMSSGFELGSNFLSGPIPSQIGLMTAMTDGLRLTSNELSAPIPSQIGLLVDFEGVDTGLLLDSNSLSSTLPSQLGELSFNADSNLNLYQNMLCAEVPTQVSALSAVINNYYVTSGNDFGTPCCETLPDTHTCEPTPEPTPVPTIGCESGTYLTTDNDGNEVCEDCAEGTAVIQNGPAFATSCTTCAAGTYAAGTGNDECTDCAAGTYQDTAGQGSCTDCEEGKYTDAVAQTECVSCTAGTYAAGTGNTACTDCAAGSYSDADESTECTDCEEGKYTDAVAQTECADCTAGTYAAGTGNTACTDCSAGSYSDADQSTECQNCEEGKYQADAGQTACTECAAGTYEDGTGSTACTDCEVGRYQDLTEQTVCVECDAGTFAEGTGNTGCQDCDAGTFAEGNGNTECTGCEVGKYQANAGETECDACGAGTYVLDEGQATCLPCNADDVIQADGTIAGGACNGFGWCSPTEGLCTCTEGENGPATGYQPEGTQPGQAGTCSQAMDANTSAFGGFFSLFLLLACFVPCLCFPWVYRAEDRLQTHLVDPYLTSYQNVYHERVTVVAEEEAAESDKHKTFKEKVWSCITCEAFRKRCCQKKGGDEGDDGEGVEMKAKYKSAPADDAEDKLEAGDKSPSSPPDIAMLKKAHLQQHPMQQMKKPVNSAGVMVKKEGTPRPQKTGIATKGYGGVGPTVQKSSAAADATEEAVPDGPTTFTCAFTLTLEDMELMAFTADKQRALAEALALELELTPEQVDVADFAAGSVVVKIRLTELPDSSACAEAAAKAEGLTNLGAEFGTCAVAEVEQIGAQKGHGAGFFDSKNPGQDIEIASMLMAEGGIDGDSNRDLHGNAQHVGDLRASDVVADGAEATMLDGETPGSATTPRTAGRERRHSMGHADEEEQDIEGMAETFEAGDDDGEEGLEDDALATGLEHFGVDQDELEEQLSEYANQLSGFMDVLPSLLLSLIELFCIFIVEMMQEIVRTLSNVYLVMQGFNGWTLFNFPTFRFNVVYDHFEETMEYCLQYVPGKPVWIAKAWTYLVNKVFKIAFDFGLVLEGVSVNCSGAQLPTKMITNIVIIIFVTFLIESKFYPLIRITSASVSKLYKGRMLVQLFITAFVVGGEATFKLFIQIAATTVDLQIVWYDHSCYDIGLKNADNWLGDNGRPKKIWDRWSNGTNTSYYNSTFEYQKPLTGFRDGDRYVAYGTWLIYVFALFPAFHIILKTSVPGLPKGCSFPDIILEDTTPEPLKHRYLYGGFGSAHLTDFEFETLKLYFKIPLTTKYKIMEDRKTTLKTIAGALSVLGVQIGVLVVLIGTYVIFPTDMQAPTAIQVFIGSGMGIGILTAIADACCGVPKLVGKVGYVYWLFFVWPFVVFFLVWEMFFRGLWYTILCILGKTEEAEKDGWPCCGCCQGTEKDIEITRWWEQEEGEEKKALEDGKAVVGGGAPGVTETDEAAPSANISSTAGSASGDGAEASAPKKHVGITFAEPKQKDEEVSKAAEVKDDGKKKNAKERDPLAGMFFKPEGGKVKNHYGEEFDNVRDMRAARRSRDLPTFMEVMWLLGREPTETLYNYFWAIRWKVWLFCKVTVGYWDNELIEAMEIKAVADRFDEDPLDDTDRDGDTLRIMGISHSLIWQVIPLGMPFAKLGEAANDAATYIDPDSGLAGYDPFYPPWARQRMEKGQRCAGLPLKNQDRDFAQDVGHPRCFKWAWSMTKFCIMMSMVLKPTPALFAVFGFLSVPIKFLDSLSVWLHLLEDTPDWLLWFEFSDNPVAQFFNHIAGAVSRACIFFFNNLSPKVVNSVANNAGDVAEGFVDRLSEAEAIQDAKDETRDDDEEDLAAAAAAGAAALGAGAGAGIAALSMSSSRSQMDSPTSPTAPAEDFATSANPAFARDGSDGVLAQVNTSAGQEVTL